MPFKNTPTPLRIAVSAGALTLPLATLFARQRDEEPETLLRLAETTMEDQIQGLEDGRYCLGFSLAQATYRQALQTTPIWRDELVVAVPPRSPLLAFDKIPLKAITQYPLILWQEKDGEVLNQQIVLLLASAGTDAKFHIAERVTTCELMEVLVAAGHGIGFSTRSRISASRQMDIVIRPLAGGPHYVTTYLIHPHQPLSAPVNRLIQRARGIQQ